MQVGLFDVSEPTAPVLDSHRAFTFVPGDPATGTPMRFAIPVSEHGPFHGTLNPDPGYWYPWKATGIFMFELNERTDDFSSLDLVGRVDVANIGTIGRDGRLRLQ